MTRLPEASFAEIAAVLLAAARGNAMSIEAIETIVVPRPASERPDTLATLAPCVAVVADLRISAAILGQLYRFFESLTPREAELRAALDHMRGDT